MKRFISILLLSIYLFNLCGYIFIYSHIKSEIKKEALKKLSATSPGLFEEIIIGKKASSKLIEWKEENEFLYKGNMYDVASIKEDDDKFYFYCIRDVNEEKLEDALKKHIENNSTDTPLNKTKRNLLKNVIFEALVSSYNKIITSVNSKREEIPNVILFSSYTSEVPTPPPNISLS